MRNRFNWLFALLLSPVLIMPALAKEKPDPRVPTPEAQALMEQVKAAYSNVQSLQAKGKIIADLDVGGQTQDDSNNFISEYKAPGRFRYEMPDSVLVGSNGEQIYVYLPDRSVYATYAAPASKVNYRELPGPLGQFFEIQDPALLLAVSAQSITDLVGQSRKVRVLDSAADAAVKTLAFTAGDGRDIELSFDARNHLLTKAKYDLATTFRENGAEQVKRAIITVDYSDVMTNPADDARFAWAPPEGAREVSGDAVMSNGEHLVGKPAPDFTLSDLSGKKVTLSSLKGKVVLVDFWATWCPPCVRFLPQIAELHHKTTGSGVEVLTVSVGDSKRAIERLLKSQNLDLPVLMDTDQSVFENLGTGGLPTTLVIDAEGNVQRVFVGVPAGGKAEIEREIAAAAAKRPG